MSFQDSIDHWEPREGLALALHNLAPYFKDSTLVEKVTNFLVKEVKKTSLTYVFFDYFCCCLLILISFLFTIFIFQGLIDRKEAVRKRMLTAAVNIVDIHGNFTKKKMILFLL